MSSDDGGYVHDPEGSAVEETAETEFDWRGWTLVGVVVLCFLVIPALILWRPPALPFRVAFLLLPLIPAFLLGATAVWAAVRGGEK